MKTKPELPLPELRSLADIFAEAAELHKNKKNKK